MPDELPRPLGPYLSCHVLQSAAGVTTLVLSGEFDLAASAPVNALFADVEASEPAAVLVDLAGVTFLDSSGIRVLLDAHSRFKGTRAFAVFNGSGQAHRALAVVGAEQILPMVTSIDDLDDLVEEEAEEAG